VRHVFNQLKEFFTGAVMPVIRQLRTIFINAMNNIAHGVGQHGPELRNIFHSVGEAIKAIAKVAMPILKFALETVLPRVIGKGIEVISDLVDIVNDVIKAFKWVHAHGGGSFSDMIGPIQTVISWFNIVIQRIQSIKNGLSDINSALGTSGLDLLHKLPLGGSLLDTNKADLAGGGGSTDKSRPMKINLHIDGREVFRAVVAQDKVFRRQNGRGALA
jgi:hypothetical protein